MFKSLLTKVRERTGGVMGLALVSLDGIAIEKVQSDPTLNLDTVIAEFTDRLKKVNQAAAEMGTGRARELVAYTERAVIVLKSVHEDYYLLCVLEPDGKHGRARHVLSTVIPDIAQALA